MKLDIQAKKTEKTKEKTFSVDLTGDRQKDMASFERLAVELYIWASDEGLFDKHD